MSERVRNDRANDETVDASKYCMQVSGITKGVYFNQRLQRLCWPVPYIMLTAFIDGQR
jgi:hypothetical protein